MSPQEQMDIGTIAAISPVASPPFSKYDRLIAKAKEVAAAPTFVVHPCDETSLRGATEAAYYSAAYRVLDVLQILPGTVSGVLLPLLASAEREGAARGDVAHQDAADGGRDQGDQAAAKKGGEPE